MYTFAYIRDVNKIKLKKKIQNKKNYINICLRAVRTYTYWKSLQSLHGDFILQRIVEKLFYRKIHLFGNEGTLFSKVNKIYMASVFEKSSAAMLLFHSYFLRYFSLAMPLFIRRRLKVFFYLLISVEFQLVLSCT